LLGQQYTDHWANKTASGGVLCSTCLHCPAERVVGFFDKNRMRMWEKKTTVARIKSERKGEIVTRK
jgi:hypothetical protein